jgi:hypothetical protein
MVSSTALGGFPSTEVFLPAVGRVPGNGGAQFFTTVWATNLTGVAETFTFQFLKQGQANGSPAAFQDTLQPGETKVYENVVETKLGLSNAIGAARVTSSGEIFVSERIFDQPPGADLGDTQGLFFAGVPKAFSISIGQSASIQGLNQGGAENFRYNFALVETAGAAATVNAQVFDGVGVLLGQKSFTLQPFEQLQPNVAEVVPGFSSINARITATVTGGAGSVLLAGAQLANVSQDSSGFEMSFRDDLLGGGGAGVTSLNSLTGAVILAAGSNVTITPAGNTLTIAASGGGSGGLTSVSHDATLAGAGTGSSPLRVAVPLILGTTNGSALEASENVSGGDSPPVISATMDGSANGEGFAIFGEIGAGITDNNFAGVMGNSKGKATGVAGQSELGTAVSGFSASGEGVSGHSNESFGIQGNTFSTADNIAGIFGSDGSGKAGLGAASAGVRGESVSGIGTIGFSSVGLGVLGGTNSGPAGVRGINISDANDHAGVLGLDGTGGAALSGALSAGVRGESNTNIGVLGASHSFAVVGKLVGPVGVQGELGSHRNSNNFAVFTFGNAFFTGSQTATGSKSFVEPHPTDPTKEIRFVCLEGPESGTYFRGTARIVGGFAKIAVPESFRSVTAEENITVQLTPTGGLAVLACIRKGLDTILVQGSSDVEFDYMVNGVRRAYKDFAVIRDNESFVPDGPLDRRFDLYAPDIQRRLVATGIYNADGTVNLATAKRLGWDKGWATDAESR